MAERLGKHPLPACVTVPRAARGGGDGEENMLRDSRGDVSK